MTLEKARLQPVSADEHETEAGDPVPVQFNPTSLQLRLTNQLEGGRSTGRARRQQSGMGSAVLSMELVFDTADEGTDEVPVSVRTKTAIVEKYVVPSSANSQTLPRLRFEWDKLIVVGLVESVDIDFDLFASNGTPLRAKVRLSIKEQQPTYQLRPSKGADRPGQGGNKTSPGEDRSAPALEGETPAQFAARQGLDPAAWRGLGVDLGAGLTLAAGVEVGFSAKLSAAAGIGLKAGVHAGAGASLEAALGLTAGAGAVAAVSAGAAFSGASAAGVALSAAGGVAAAIETVKVAGSEAAAHQARLDFAARSDLSPMISAGPMGALLAARGVKSEALQAHTPLSRSGPRSVTQQRAAAAAPTPPLADARSSSYGLGVPLRPLIKTTTEQRLPRPGRAGEAAPPFRKVPVQAPWVALPRPWGKGGKP